MKKRGPDVFHILLCAFCGKPFTGGAQIGLPQGVPYVYNAPNRREVHAECEPAFREARRKARASAAKEEAMHPTVLADLLKKKAASMDAGDAKAVLDALIDRIIGDKA